jgi:Cadherin domain
MTATTKFEFAECVIRSSWLCSRFCSFLAMAIILPLDIAFEGTFVCHVAITDPDTAMNARVECSVLSNGKESLLFHLEPLIYDQSSSSSPASGSTEYKLVTAAMLDRESFSKHRVTIHCRDSGQPPLAASKSLEIHVDDENDNTPFLPVDVFFVAIVENNQLGAFVIRCHR